MKPEKPREMQFEEEWVRCLSCHGSGIRTDEKGRPLVQNERRLPCVYCSDAGHPGVMLVSRKVRYSQPTLRAVPPPEPEAA